MNTELIVALWSDAGFLLLILMLFNRVRHLENFIEEHLSKLYNETAEIRADYHILCDRKELHDNPAPDVNKIIADQGI